MKANYPALVRRYLATLIDIIVPLTIAALIGRTLSLEFELSDLASVMILSLPFLIYEPIMTAKYATVGQLIFKFRVRKLNESNRITIGQSFFRLAVKYALGGISLMTIPARSDRRAIHDLMSGSIVVNSKNLVQSY